MPQDETFGHFLRDSRRPPDDPAHVSQRELARRLTEAGLPTDHSAISRIESGDYKRVSAAFVASVGRALGWSADQTLHALDLIHVETTPQPEAA